MSRSAYTIRKLRELAVQRLGALAAQLKTKDELYDALAEHAPDAVGLKGPVKESPKAPKKKPAARVPPASPPKPVAVKAKVKESPPAPAITSPQRLPKKPRRAAEREVVRDFFVPPGARALPASFGDDRVMLFPRDPGGIYVSWDLSPSTWGHGGLRLVIRTHDGQEIWSQELHAAQGAVSLAGEFGGASIRAVVERNGSGIGASPAVLMPGSASAFAERWKVRVEPHARLPVTPEVIGPSYGPPELPGAVGESSRLLRAAPAHGPGGAPSRLG